MKLTTKHSFLLCFIILLACNACKVKPPTKTVQVPAEVEENNIVVLDTLVLEMPDTVKIPQDSVEIKVYRLLKDTVSIIGVGDIMMGTNFPNKGYLPPNQGKDLLSAVMPILQNADVTFGNLEGVILNDGGDRKYCRDTTKCYLFRSPEYMVQNLADAGFDVVSTANNHAGDFGTPGRINTARVLDSLGIKHAGQLTHPYTTFMREGMRYGFTAFSPNRGTLSIHDVHSAKQIVAFLDSISDIVIVSFHGGAEGKDFEHVTRKQEQFYGENRGNVYAFAHAMIDAGADIIFGHGPHVTRAIEVYKDRFISYSLGNFCTYARFNLSGPNSLAPIIKVYTGPAGGFLKGEIIAAKQVAPGGPILDPGNKVIDKIRALTAKDFPETKIKIDERGIITYLQN